MVYATKHTAVYVQVRTIQGSKKTSINCVLHKMESLIKRANCKGNTINVYSNTSV